MGKLLACNISYIANASDNFSDSHHSAISCKLWWCHDMGRLSTLLALCEWNTLVTGGILTQWAGDENIWCFLWCYREQAAGKTAELSVIWDAMMLTWHHWNIDGLVQERRNSSALAMELRLSCTNPSIYTVTWNMWQAFQSLISYVLVDQSQQLSTHTGAYHSIFTLSIKHVYNKQTKNTCILFNINTSSQATKYHMEWMETCSAIFTSHVEVNPCYTKPKCTYHQTSNVRCNKSHNLNVCHLVLHLSLPNPLKLGFKSRMSM